ncbi:MAG: hypothetical protein D6712_20745, partial [Chloroflexi bacterium]
MLFERDRELRTLGLALNQVRRGTGQLVLICGEAGIGKTSLIEHFVQSQPQAFRFLRGACDPFTIPHPLCPLIDIARQIPDEELSEMLWEPSRPIIFNACITKLQTANQPTVVVFEDIHWADEATYDLIIYLGRRIHETNCLMIVTYRNDILSLNHPIHNVVGRLSGTNIHRLNLKRLSKELVVSLAKQKQISGEWLYQLTSGNPFYVTEFLANNTDDFPRSVTESVVARYSQQPPEVRKILEFASIIPKKTCNYWLLEAIWDIPLELFEQCAASGLVDIDNNGLIFRHALMRQAIAESLPPIRRNALHTLAIKGLIQSHEQGINVGFTHIVYHAEHINDIPLLLKYAPLAAQEAINLGSHREAANHYRIMLAHLHRLEPTEQATVHDALAYECYLIGQIGEALQNTEKALEIWRQQGEIAQEVNALRRLSRFHWFLGNRDEAERYAEQALDKAKQLPDSLELAKAYSNRSQLHMLKFENRQAIDYAEKALQLAQKLQAFDVMAHALNNLGTAQWLSGDDIGYTNLVNSLDLSLEQRLEEHAARAYTNITSLAVDNRQYALAMQYFNDGLAYCEQQNLDSWDIYMRGWLARCYFERGMWDDAEMEVERVLTVEDIATALRQPALFVKAYIAVRRGDDAANELIESAWQVADEMQEIGRIVPTLAARAEYAWGKGGLSDLVDDLNFYYERVLQQGTSWQVGVLAFWLWLAGVLTDIPASAAKPYQFQMLGDWEKAAELWQSFNCPYEQAFALQFGDNDAKLQALSIFEDLGAKPAIQRLRNEMRQHGIIVPRSETLSNPAGLTHRQLQVLALLAQGMSDAEIAERLVISIKTVGHHVSAILSKLGVKSR